MTNSDSKKHHYIPVFYLQKWINSNRKVFSFSRTYNGKLDIQEKVPEALGWEEYLYTSTNITSGKQENVVETNFFMQLDDRGAKILNKILESGISTLNVSERQSWATFIYYLRIRTPSMKRKNIERTPKIVDNIIPENVMCEFPVEWIERANQSLPSIIYPESKSTKEVQESVDIISKLNWFIDDFKTIVDDKFSLLTSDNPRAHIRTIKNLESNSFKELLKHPAYTIALPISPSKCFMATAANFRTAWEYLDPKQRLKYLN